MDVLKPSPRKINYVWDKAFVCVICSHGTILGQTVCEIGLASSGIVHNTNWADPSF